MFFYRLYPEFMFDLNLYNAHDDIYQHKIYRVNAYIFNRERMRKKNSTKTIRIHSQSTIHTFICCFSFPNLLTTAIRQTFNRVREIDRKMCVNVDFRRFEICVSMWENVRKTIHVIIQKCRFWCRNVE